MTPRAMQVPTAVRVVVAGVFLWGCASPSSPPVSTSPSPAMGGSATGDLTADERVRHVLDRLSFGPRPGDIERVTAMGVDRWIDMQLHPSTIDDAGAERLTATLETQRKTPWELIADHPDPQEIQQRIRNLANPTHEDSAMIRAAQQTTQRLTAQIQTVRMLRAVATERQLQEVMTCFWENHFSVFLGKSPNRWSMVEYDRDVIRPRALGKFRDLLGAVAKSPQMLFYLDNFQSGVDSLHPNVDEARIDERRARSPDSLARLLSGLPRRRPRGVNENYARELMELHTLGVDGGYTQKDVQEVARALTGWTIDAPQLGGHFVFRPELHDAGKKVVLGHVLPAGRGIEDGQEVLDILARAPATAHFITTKLARHFVSDDPPPGLVDRCAAEFSRTDGDIRETVRCIVTSPEFFSRAAYRAKVKTPFELVASALRALDAQADTTPRQAQIVAQLGQPIYGRLTPDGWPDKGDAWMNTGAILNRINFGLRLAAGQVPGARLAAWPPAMRLRQLPPEQQVNGVVNELLGGDVSADTRAILVSGENPMLRNASAPSMRPPPGLSGLPAIVGLTLGSPEFQRR